MPAAPAEGADDHGQQPVQRLADGGCLAREETDTYSGNGGAVTACRPREAGTPTPFTAAS